MRLLVIGSGGREHAVAWKLSQSPLVEKIFVAPGNAGTALEAKLENVPMTSIPDLVTFARQEKIDLTVVGPEVPLTEGIVDTFQASGLRIFGPTRNGARLEGSKSFAKAFMLSHGIPTAACETFDDAAAAHRYIDQHSLPIVIKADGLAAGKGVVVAQTLSEAHAAVDAMLVDNRLGTAGAHILIEDYLEGEEASFIVLSDGKNVLPLATSQDHKRLRDNDEGPNTGGMGAYSPAPVITPELHDRIMQKVIMPVIQGMAQQSQPYVGFLYAGLMISPQGEVRVLEFNCRLGDPETQTIMLRLKSDLFILLEHAVNGTLDQASIEWDQRVALCVVMAAQGYPDNPRKNDIIHGLDSIMADQRTTDEFHIFHAGTARSSTDPTKIVTSGGRVLGVTALGKDIRQAQSRAYAIAADIHFDGCQMRRDIGHKGLSKQ
ncbi:MAG TPA: phosphoribosylamine--glycine ligase [Nitrosomonas europaea]|uniref:phosphoribosylamine--glycine ligase n=1 Tax=Nitrosomonas europaea TaxID=915 RepID=UPI0024925FF4|nr:phosphoribosylamine--glycine ligase [Nitrosomonas europaea]HRO55291.1 phosphoribosylamine--glycine ligase [Nitrosomonas europaea]HUM72999.1 phosphoribosylamine--glycine ligase [Nitrosomonas europaea]